MYVHDRVSHSSRASSLVRRLVEQHDSSYGVSSMTCSIYDTAWVAMIAKTVNGNTRYLFPASFEYLLNTQQPDGGWGGQKFSSEIDCVLNSLAALLALSRHISRPYQLRKASEDLIHRKTRAIYFLETKFSDWDVNSIATNTGFQPLITKLLQMLELEDVRFAFPGRELFLETKPNKRSNHTLAILYSNTRTVATHYLEGRIGEIDFDRVGQHKVCGSMMASPASTAAYLMNCTEWDDEAEAYLSHIVSVGDEKSFGGVPAKFPTTVFELAGVISILLENGFTTKDLGTQTLNTAANFLQDCLQLEGGVTGFAPYVESDADNTARTISALALLGRSASPQGLIKHYESPEYFKTYVQDKSPSFRTNCHVLKALLDLVPENSEQMPQIQKITAFLCNYWWTTNGRIEDQSNRSPNYPIMLMVEVFVRLIQLWARGCVPIPDDLAIQDKVIICLFQALTRTLHTQKSNGSWGSGGCETTAYAIITLKRLSSFTSAPMIRTQLTNAIENGRRFLSKNFRPFSEPDHIWTGKTTSGSSVLYQAYIMAALQAPMSKQSSPTIESHFEIPLAKITIQTKYYAKQAWFANVPEWLIQACLVESRLFLPQIRIVRYAVFPSDNLGEDSHFESIPFSWIVASNLDNRAIGAEFLYQMMILSVLARQLDEYIDSTVRESFSGCLFEVEDIIYSIFQELELYNKDQCFCGDHGHDRESTATSISDVRSVLYRFISHVLNHPYVLMASGRDQSQLKSELLTFLLGRISQLATQHSPSATDQTPHAYTFAFLSCLVGNQGSNCGVGLRRDFLETPEQQYLAADLCRHMSIISFMSNNVKVHENTVEIQSKPRSTSLGNSGRPLSRSVSSVSTSSSSYDDSQSPISPVSSVSSVCSGSPSNAFFPKVLDQLPHTSPLVASSGSLQMSRLINHERQGLSLSLQSISESGINQRTGNILKLFVDVTELSEQIFNDPNIGSYQPITAHEIIEQACIFEAPPLPPKRRGSVAAARAALTILPLMPKQHQTKFEASPLSRQQAAPLQPSQHLTHNYLEESDRSVQRPEAASTEVHEMAHQPPKPISSHVRHASRSQSFDGFSDRTLTPSQDVYSSVPMGRDWSWNKRPGRRPSQLSEISRIERIMNDVDGIKPTQRRTSSEGDAGWISKPKIDVRKRLASSGVDAEAIKLAKARVQTQKRAGVEAQRRAVESQRMIPTGLQSKSMVNVSTKEVKPGVASPDNAGWVKAPPALVEMPGMEERTGKLHKASRLGGPRWKAPF